MITFLSLPPTYFLFKIFMKAVLKQLNFEWEVMGSSLALDKISIASQRKTTVLREFQPTASV